MKRDLESAVCQRKLFAAHLKHHTGMTLLCYHHLIRCEKAKEMLLQTNLSVSRIGESVGFISSSHFTHIFRKTENCTPTEYRRLHGPDREERAEP